MNTQNIVPKIFSGEQFKKKTKIAKNSSKSIYYLSLEVVLRKSLLVNNKKLLLIGLLGLNCFPFTSKKWDQSNFI